MDSVLNGTSCILIKKCLINCQVTKILIDTMITHPKNRKGKFFVNYLEK